MNQQLKELYDDIKKTEVVREQKAAEEARAQNEIRKIDELLATKRKALNDWLDKEYSSPNPLHAATAPEEPPDDPFPAIDEFIKSLLWQGSSPKGSWVNPKDVQFEPLSESNDKSMAGSYTLNSQIRTHTGEEQVEFLTAIAYDQIPKHVLRKKSRASAIKWMLECGYNLSDLRAAEYIVGSNASADATAAKDSIAKLLGTVESYLRKKKQSWVWIYFPGSVVFGEDGIARIPCLSLNGVGASMSRGYDYLRHPVGECDIYIVNQRPCLGD